MLTRRICYLLGAAIVVLIVSQASRLGSGAGQSTSDETLGRSGTESTHRRPQAAARVAEGPTLGEFERVEHPEAILQVGLGGASNRRSMDAGSGDQSSAIGLTEVHVRSEGADSGRAQLRVSDSKSGLLLSVEPLLSGEAVISVKPGMYELAIGLDQCCVGPSLQHLVTTTPSEIEVEPPLIFDLSWTVIDVVDGSVVVHPRVELTRVDDAGQPCGEAIRAAADNSGRLYIHDVCAGKYSLSLSADGYESIEFETELPGPYDESLRDGVLEWEGWYCHPLERYTFALAGVDAWDRPESFRVSSYQSSAAEPVSFDASGLAYLDFADPVPPIEVQLEYPDGSRGIIYLPDLPEERETHIMLDVGRAHVLEVDLRVASGLDEELFASEAYLQATYADSLGGSRQLNTRIYAPGVAELRGPFPERVMLSLTTVDKSGRMFPRAAREIEVSGETTRAVLNVTEDVVWVKVVDGNDAPIVDAHVNIMTVPNHSAWITGGPADADGRVPITVPEGTESLVSCYVGYDTVAIDCPLPTETQDGDLILRVDGLVESSFAVLLDGAPAFGHSVLIEGARTASEQVTELRVKEGQSAPSVRLLRGSQAVAKVMVRENEWAERSKVDVLPGLNQLRVRSMGTLRLRSADQVSEVIALDTGVPISDWVENGRTRITRGDAGTVTVDVPVGAYQARFSDGSTKRVIVARGATANAY